MGKNKEMGTKLAKLRKHVKSVANDFCKQENEIKESRNEVIVTR